MQPVSRHPRTADSFVVLCLFAASPSLCHMLITTDSNLKVFSLLSLLRMQIRWTKTAGSVSDRFQDSSVFNETLHIAKIQRTQGGRYYCKAENGLGSPAIKSIRVDVYCK